MKGAGAFRLIVLVAGVIFLSSDGIIGRVDSSVFFGEQDMNLAYCFKFTWLGPKWDNTSNLNTTCADLKGSPCKEPLVITHDSTPPNTTFMWENFDISQITCKLTKGEACTKWVNYYGNEIENITYMCSKFTVEGRSRANWEGCELQSINSTSTEVCACRSEPGKEPCNAATTSLPHFLVILATLLAVFFARG